ncbi:hypothetical protein HYPSUDRAFT_44865, partial [Hypholoma sublateritium FD-334 SS-4]
MGVRGVSPVRYQSRSLHIRAVLCQRCIQPVYPPQSLTLRGLAGNYVARHRAFSSLSDSPDDFFDYASGRWL